MSAEDLPGRRSMTRFLTDLDLVIADLSENVIDERAQAHDITPKGFRAETKASLKEGDKFKFHLQVEDEDPIVGLAQVVWVGQNPWGWWNVGVKITKISWRDRRRLDSNLLRHGYDFAGLARKAALALFWFIVVAGLDNIVFHQPQARKVLLHLTPVVIASVFLAWGLLLLFRRD